jgi:hypothetical protein
MIAVVSSHRNVAVVKLRGHSLVYRARGSSREKVIGTIPLGHGDPKAIVGRKPAMRSPYIVVELADSTVFTAQLGLHKIEGSRRKAYQLGPWEEVPGG